MIATKPPTLTPRERECLRLIGQGLRPRQVAETMGISMKTYSCYQQNLKHKLGFACSRDLDRFAWSEFGGA